MRAPAGPATYEKLIDGPFGRFSGRGSDVTSTFFARRLSIVAASGPTAEANGPYAGNVSAAINFSSAGSTDPDGNTELRVVNPDYILTEQTFAVQSLLSESGIRFMFSSFVSNFAGFSVVGVGGQTVVAIAYDRGQTSTGRPSIRNSRSPRKEGR